MTFPWLIPIGPWRLHPHPVFETAAYLVGFRLYLALRRQKGDTISDGDRWFVVAAAAVGALIGSKLLYWFEDAWLTLRLWRDPAFLLGGKTVVGDVRSVKKSCVHIVHPHDGRLIPFDTYNLFYRDDLERTRLAPLRGKTVAGDVAQPFRAAEPADKQGLKPCAT